MDEVEGDVLSKAKEELANLPHVVKPAPESTPAGLDFVQIYVAG